MNLLKSALALCDSHRHLHVQLSQVSSRCCCCCVDPLTGQSRVVQCAARMRAGLRFLMKRCVTGNQVPQRRRRGWPLLPRGGAARGDVGSIAAIATAVQAVSVTVLRYLHLFKPSYKAVRCPSDLSLPCFRFIYDTRSLRRLLSVMQCHVSRVLYASVPCAGYQKRPEAFSQHMLGFLEHPSNSLLHYIYGISLSFVTPTLLDPAPLKLQLCLIDA